MANPNRVGLLIGALIGGWHLVWSVLVGIGWAQPILDFIFWAHMIEPVYFVKPFDAVAAVSLIVITTVRGYIFGFLGGIIWTDCIVTDQGAKNGWSLPTDAKPDHAEEFIVSA